MKRLISRLAIAAVGASTIGVVVGATPAFAVKSCTGTLTGDVNSSVVVPANAVCTLQNAAVHGSVTVSANGALLVKGSTIDASLNATSPKWIGIETFGAASQVAGGITITGTSAVPPASAANFICGATTGGSLSLKNSKATAPYDIGGGVCGSGNTFGARAVMQGNASTIRFDTNSVGTSLNATTNHGASSEAKTNTAGTSITITNNNPCWLTSANTAGTTDTEDTCP